MKANWRDALKVVVFFGLGLLLLYLALRGIKWADLLALHGRTNYWIVAASLPLMLAAHLARSERWRQLLAAAGAPVRTLSAFYALMAGYMVNYGLPRAGEVVRCTLLLRSDKAPLTVSLGTVVTERAADVMLLGLMVLALLGLEADKMLILLEQVKLPGMSYWLVGLMLVAVAGFVLVVWQKERMLKLPIIGKILGFAFQTLDAVLSVRHLKSPLGFTCYSIAIWAGYCINMWFIMLAISGLSDASLYTAVVLTVFGAVGMAVPVPGGIGSYHAAIMIGGASFGIPEIEAAQIAILGHASALLVNVAVGAVGYGWHLSKPEAAAAAN